MVKLIMLIVGLIIHFVFASITIAQSDIETESIAIQFDGNEINFYRVDNVGNFILLQSLNEVYIRGQIVTSNEWEIMRLSDITLSPNRQQLAFTTVSNITRETMLFVYSIGETDFQKITVPGLGQVLWSPDGTEILLTPPDTLLGGGFSVLEDAYLYTLETNSVRLLVSGQNSAISDFVWLPNGETMIYEGGFSTCVVQECIYVSDLYMVTRVGQITNQLTDLSTFITTELMLNSTIFSLCQVEHPKWSAFNDRLYYTLDCQNSGDFIFSYLMSVNLGGENRLEGQTTNMLPNMIRSKIIDIHPSSTSEKVYVSTSVSSEEVVDGFTNIIGSWHVLENSGQGTLSLISSQIFGDLSEPPAQTSALSIDDDHLVVGGGTLDGVTLSTSGYLAIINLTTGQVTEYQIPKSICDVEWLDEQTVRYHQSNGTCSNDFRLPTSIWLLNTSSGIQTEITTNLNGYVWILKIPEFITEPTFDTPTPSPTATP